MSCHWHDMGPWITPGCLVTRSCLLWVALLISQSHHACEVVLYSVRVCHIIIFLQNIHKKHSMKFSQDLNVMHHFASIPQFCSTWWRPQMDTFSALLALCAGNSPVTGGFPSQRPVMQVFIVFFDLHLNKRLSKQSWGWWFETPSRSLCHHCNDMLLFCNHWHLHNMLTQALHAGGATASLRA